MGQAQEGSLMPPGEKIHPPHTGNEMYGFPSCYERCML